MLPKVNLIQVIKILTISLLLLLFFIFLTVFILKTNGIKPTTQTSNTNYYIDCVNGADENAGTSPAMAWQTLNRPSRHIFSAGDTIYLKAGCVFTQAFILNESGASDNPITITAYGNGNPPIIQSNKSWQNPIELSGVYIIVDGIHFEGIAPTINTTCDGTPVGVGEIWGVALRNTAAHVIIRNSHFKGFSSGVYISMGSNNNLITHNEFHDNRMMKKLDPTPNNDAGAFGVEVSGNQNEISYNIFSGHDACSYDYDRDGSAVEIFGGSDNYIHHNTALNNDTFTELGNWGAAVAANNLYTYNLVYGDIPSGSFLVVPGNSSAVAYNNTVYLTGSESDGIVCYVSCSHNTLVLQNNILWANQSSWADGIYVESNNLYWNGHGSANVTPPILHKTSIIGDPFFVNAPSDFLVTETSPVIDAGADISIPDLVDFLGNAVPTGSHIDIGAFEYPQAPPPAPVAHTLILPIVFNQFLSAPDLIVESMIVRGETVTVVIANVGNAPVFEPFWVDVYVNPASPPTAVNQTWDRLGIQGLVWGVENGALPLMDGQSITLTVNDSYYHPELSSFSSPISTTVAVYAQVDSANNYTTYGAILEADEITGDPYNNIFGPIFASESP